MARWHRMAILGLLLLPASCSDWNVRDRDSGADGGDGAADSDSERVGSLEGSLADAYDLTFDEVRATQYVQSKALAIEFVRSPTTSQEKPIIMTISPTPEGPGTVESSSRITITNSVLPGGAALPELTSRSCELTAFTPGAVGSAVEGTFEATFVNSGTGGTYSLDGSFRGQLDVL